MLRAFRRLILLAPAMAAVISVALAASTGSLALASGNSGPFWGSTTAYSSPSVPLADFDTATCVSGGVCLAGGGMEVGGSASDSAPLVVAESGGTWGLPESATVIGAANPAAGFTSLACLSASSCVGVGYNSAGGGVYTPFGDSIALSGTTVAPSSVSTLTLPSSPAGNATEAAALGSVSCTATACKAVGSYYTSANKEEPLVATYTNGTWTAVALNGPATATGGANLTAISCPGDGACEAVGNYLDGAGDVRSWAVQLTGANTPQLITDPPGTVVATGTLPRTPTPISATAQEQMFAISCPSVNACTAVGTYKTGATTDAAMAVKITNGAPAAASAMPATGAQLTAVTGIWCQDAANCTAEGDSVSTGGGSSVVNPLTAYEATGTWSAFTTLPGGAPSASAEYYVVGLGCTAIDSCITTGLEISSLSVISPMYAMSAVPLQFATFSLPTAVVGQPYDGTLEGSGGSGTNSWSINGTLPAGLTLDTATGVISGTPTTPGTATFSAQIASAGPPAQASSNNLALVVLAAPVLKIKSIRTTPTGMTATVSCSVQSCSGTAVITGVEQLKASGVTAHAKAPTQPITLARSNYSIAKGRQAKIVLKLTGTARALVRRLHKISGTLTLTTTHATKPSVSRRVTFKS